MKNRKENKKEKTNLNLFKTLVAFFNFNLVEYIHKLVGVEGLDKIIYGIIALAGLYKLIILFMFRN